MYAVSTELNLYYELSRVIRCLDLSYRRFLRLRELVFRNQDTTDSRATGMPPIAEGGTLMKGKACFHV